MNLILSSKVAKKLQIKGHLIKDFDPNIDTWRVDCASLVKRSIFIITNEKTLYTCISSYKNGFGGIIKKIASASMKDNLNSSDINYVKSQNRSIVSSMNNMKQLINQIDKYNPSDNETYEKLINLTPFKYLSYRSPAEVHSSNMSSRLVD
jgi:spore coat polysaccharide biosynthesis predicted glycosyltransferase SpsG